MENPNKTQTNSKAQTKAKPLTVIDTSVVRQIDEETQKVSADLQSGVSIKDMSDEEETESDEDYEMPEAPYRIKVRCMDCGVKSKGEIMSLRQLDKFFGEHIYEKGCDRFRLKIKPV